MNTLLIILSVVAALVVLLLIASLIIKKEYALERTIAISKPRHEVFDYLRWLRNHKNFVKWSKMDPAMRQTFNGNDGAVGFVSAWESDNKNVGKGEQEIKKIAEGERIDYELRFEKPFKGTAYAYIITTPVSTGETKVSWGMEGSSPRPMNVMSAMMRKMLERDLDVSLNDLKSLLEK